MRVKLNAFFHAFLAVAVVVSSALPSPAAVASPIAVSPLDLEVEIASRIDRVPEFRFIREEAKRLGVSIFLFGGTAAGFAHYVKQDVQRERGDSSFQKERFDYDFTNIYRSTQDLDIVIDGSAEQAEALRASLMSKYPHFQGNKEQWEVRLLRQDLGDKQALLKNTDFLNQHTDSHSTGMIDVTENSRDVVRDLRDWESRDPQFLRDVAEGKIRFYFSDKHETTSRFMKGLNPPILSVVRYFTKAFQYQLDMRPEDRTLLGKMIASFDPRKLDGGYAKSWLSKNGSKLFRHAVDIEFAWNVLQENGLRAKLIAAGGSKDTVESLAWWMSKEPLRARVVGAGSGRTARQLGLDVVAHETRSFLAYESITRSAKGTPNVLISRSDAAGEAAAFGEGFYTRGGRRGAVGSGLTVRFRVNPDARDGTDFSIHEFKDKSQERYVVFQNKNALEIIPESINVDLLGYFEILKTIDASERGILLKLKRKLLNRWPSMTSAEQKKVVAFVQQRAREADVGYRSDAVLNEWFSMSISQSHPEIVETALEEGRALKSLLEHFVSNHPPTPLTIRIVDMLLSHPTTRGSQNEVIWSMVGPKDRMGRTAEPMPYAKDWMNHSRFASFVKKAYELATAGGGTGHQLGVVLSQNTADFLLGPKGKEAIQLIIANGNNVTYDVLIERVFAKSDVLLDARQLEWAALMSKKDSQAASKIAVHLAHKVIPRMSPPDQKWIDFVVNMKTQNGGYQLLEGVLRDPRVAKYPQFSGWLLALRDQLGHDAATKMLEFVDVAEARKIANWALAKTRENGPSYKLELETLYAAARAKAKERTLPTRAVVAEDITERAIRGLRAETDLNKAWYQATLLIARKALTDELLIEVLKKPATSYGISNVIEKIAEAKLDTLPVRTAIFWKIEEMRRHSLQRAMQDFTHDGARKALFQIMSRAAPTEPLMSDAMMFLWQNASANASPRREIDEVPNLQKIRDGITTAMEVRAQFERSIGLYPSDANALNDIFDRTSWKFQAQPNEFLRYMWDQFLEREREISQQKLNKRASITVPLRFFAFSNLMNDATFRAEFAQTNVTLNTESASAITELTRVLEMGTTAESVAFMRGLTNGGSIGSIYTIRSFVDARHRRRRWNFAELGRELANDTEDKYWHRSIHEWVIGLEGPFDVERHRMIKGILTGDERGSFFGRAVEYAIESDTLSHDPKWTTELLDRAAKSDSYTAKDVGHRLLESYSKLLRDPKSIETMTPSRAKAFERMKPLMAEIAFENVTEVGMQAIRDRRYSSQPDLGAIQERGGMLRFAAYIANVILTEEQQLELAKKQYDGNARLFLPVFFRVSQHPEFQPLMRKTYSEPTGFEKAQIEFVADLHSGTPFADAVAKHKPEWQSMLSVYESILEPSNTRTHRATMTKLSALARSFAPSSAPTAQAQPTNKKPVSEATAASAVPRARAASARTCNALFK